LNATERDKITAEIHDLTVTLTKQPHDISALLTLATDLIAVADFSQAQIVLAQVHQLAPEKIEVPYNQAIIAHQLKQDEQALRLLSPLLKTKLVGAASYLMAVIYFEQNQIQLANAFALTAAEQATAGLPEYLLLAQILTKQHLWTTAQPYAQKAYDLAQDDPDVLFVLGGCLINTPDQKSAGTQLLKRAAQLAPQKYQTAVAAIFPDN
jgi:tetratricopeptide (TPR) repeat protein